MWSLASIMTHGRAAATRDDAGGMWSPIGAGRQRGGYGRDMDAADAYTMERAASGAGPWWRRFLARGFGALGEYPEASQVLIAEAATGRVLVSFSGDQATVEAIAADLETLSADEFAHRWLPAQPPGTG